MHKTTAISDVNKTASFCRKWIPIAMLLASIQVSCCRKWLPVFELWKHIADTDFPPWSCWRETKQSFYTSFLSYKPPFKWHLLSRLMKRSTHLLKKWSWLQREQVWLSMIPPLTMPNYNMLFPFSNVTLVGRLLFHCEGPVHCPSALLGYYLLKIITANSYLLHKSILHTSGSVLHLHCTCFATK